MTCHLTDNSTHNTSEPDAPYVMADVTAGDGSDCTGLMSLSISFKDKQGGFHRAETDSRVSAQKLNLYVDGAYSSVKTVSQITFDQCDPDHSATCFLEVTTSPK